MRTYTSLCNLRPQNRLNACSSSHQNLFFPNCLCFSICFSKVMRSDSFTSLRPQRAHCWLLLHLVGQSPSLCPFFLGPRCRGPLLHVILLVWASTPFQEVCLDPVPASLHVDQYLFWPHVVHRFPPAQQLLEQAVLTVFVLVASAQSTRLPVPTLTDFSISFLVRAS